MRPDRTLQLAEGTPFLSETMIEDLYVPIPTKTGTKLMREDVLDNLTDAEFEDYLDALEMSGMGLSGKRKEERKKRREERKEKRKERKEAKTSKKEAKTAIKLAKADAIKSGTWTGGAGGIIDKIGGVVGKIVSPDAGAKDFEMTYSDSEAEPKKDNTMKYVLIGGGVLIGGILLYTLFKPKKGRR